MRTHHLRRRRRRSCEPRPKPTPTNAHRSGRTVRCTTRSLRSSRNYDAEQRCPPRLRPSKCYNAVDGTRELQAEVGFQSCTTTVSSAPPQFESRRVDRVTKGNQTGDLHRSPRRNLALRKVVPELLPTPNASRLKRCILLRDRNLVPRAVAATYHKRIGMIRRKS